MIKILVMIGMVVLLWVILIVYINVATNVFHINTTLATAIIMSLFFILISYLIVDNYLIR